MSHVKGASSATRTEVISRMWAVGYSWRTAQSQQYKLPWLCSCSPRSNNPGITLYQRGTTALCLFNWSEGWEHLLDLVLATVSPCSFLCYEIPVADNAIWEACHVLCTVQRLISSLQTLRETCPQDINWTLFIYYHPHWEYGAPCIIVFTSNNSRE